MERTAGAQLKWCEGTKSQFGSEWHEGDVVGLAVSVPGSGSGAGEPAEAGMWVSVNGSFASPNGAMVGLEDLGVARGAGVFAAISGSQGTCHSDPVQSGPRSIPTTLSYGQELLQSTN